MQAVVYLANKLFHPSAGGLHASAIKSLVYGAHILAACRGEIKERIHWTHFALCMQFEQIRKPGQNGGENAVEINNG